MIFILNKFISFATKLSDLLIKPILDNLLVFSSFYLAGFTTAIFPTIVFHTKLLRISFFTWIFDVYIICLFLQLFPSKVKKWPTILIAIPFYFLAIIDIYCLITHYTHFNPEILNLILDTNRREAHEYFVQYIQSETIILPMGIILIIIILHFLIRRKKNLLTSFIFHTRFITILKSVVALLVISSIYLSLPFRISFIKLLNAETIFEIDNYVSYQALNTPFHNLLFGLKLRNLERKELGKLAEVQQNIQIDSCSNTSPEIVFIIGESYIKSHSQLYGYSKATTPLEVQRTVDTGNGILIPFTNVITTSNYTSTVFKNIFSLKSIDEPKPWGQSLLFPVLFKKAGYHVTFITSQYVNDNHRDVFDLSGGLFLNNNDISSLAFDCRNDKAPRYDETLLEFYDSLKIFKKEHNLTIFHLIGQHIDFYKRSPEKWKKFKVKDYQDRQDINEKEKSFVADYDNATLYNDYVVDQIIKRFEDKDAVVIYMPDHGEGCYDGGHKLGRMPKGEYSKSILQNEYDIPFWIWCSKLYQENHPQIIQQIKDSPNRPFMTDDIPHLLLYLGGIKCQVYQEKKNLISPNYDVNRKRLLNGEVDYDSIIRR
ncbi:MAG: hypothetical protein E7107_03560 [Prevotella sp.]|nr:hypothetical protein [Prevotella sp.]